MRQQRRTDHEEFRRLGGQQPVAEVRHLVCVFRNHRQAQTQPFLFRQVRLPQRLAELRHNLTSEGF